MLTISADQVRAFEAPMRRRFEDSMVEHILVRSHIAQSLAANQVRERIHNLIDDAEKHGIDDETDVRHLIELVFDDLPDAMQDPAVVEILESSDLSSSAKVAFVADILRSHGA